MRVIHYGQIERMESVRERARKEEERTPPTATQLHANTCTYWNGSPTQKQASFNTNEN